MTKKEIKSLLTLAQPYRGALAMAAVLMLLQSLASLSVPWLAGNLTQTLLHAESLLNWPTHSYFIALIVLFGLQAGLSVAHNYLVASTGEQVIFDQRVNLYEHLQSLPLQFHNERRKGDVLTLLTRDLDNLGGFVSGTLVAVLPLLLTFCAALVLMMQIDWQLSLVVGAAVPVFFLVVNLLGREVQQVSGALAEAHARANSIAEENLSLLPMIKAFSREPQASNSFQQHSRRVLRLSQRHALLLSRMEPILRFLLAVGIVGVLWMASTRLIQNQLSAGELVSFFLYGLLLTRPLSGLAAVYGDAYQASAAFQRVSSVLEVTPEPNRVQGYDLSSVKGFIEFRKVQFAYPDRGPVFNGINLRIGARETIAITGPNGAGKTTLINLLMRFCEPVSGQIRVDGLDISRISLTSLRSHIGLVSQRILLFNASIRENIAYGDPNASDAQIEASAKTAQAHEMIMQLPNGYDTVIGEQGVRLSGGQQQRIALARALLKDPKILILDEATSMFDPRGEKDFIQHAHSLFRGRTVILITHSNASLQLAHRVYRISAGNIEETTQHISNSLSGV